MPVKYRGQDLDSLGCYDDDKKLVTAEVIDGKIAVLPEIGEGSRVAILAADDGEPIALSSSEEEELSEAMAQSPNPRPFKNRCPPMTG